MNDTPKVEPTEKAQIVLTFEGPSQQIARYNSAKKAEAAVAKLTKAWRAYKESKLMRGDQIFDLPNDMFDSYIDISRLMHFALVVYTKRDKFIPR